MKFPRYPTYISLPSSISTSLPSGFHDVRYTEELVSYFIERYTDPSDTVLDPFAGFGTTLNVAKRLNRTPYGVEIDDDKIAYMRDSFGFGRELVHGDVNRLYLDRIFPSIDFVMTSPPYMGRSDKSNALSDYRYAGNYDTYLSDLQTIFTKIHKLLSDDAVVVLEVSNLKDEDCNTTLAWDIGYKLSEIMTFRGEIIINWTGDRVSNREGLYNYGYDHSYCLIFTP